MKSSLIGLVFFGTVLVAGTVAAQSPVATQGNGQGNGQGKGTESPFATQGEGTDIPDRIGPEVVQASPAALVAGAVTQPLVAVTTYHYDNHRTGWNNQETTLSATSFPSTFGMLLQQPVQLDDQVDAQPLVVCAAKSITGVPIIPVCDPPVDDGTGDPRFLTRRIIPLDASIA